MGLGAAETFDTKSWILIASAAVLAAPVFLNRRSSGFSGFEDGSFCPTKGTLLLGSVGLFAAGVAARPWYDSMMK